MMRSIVVAIVLCALGTTTLSAQRAAGTRVTTSKTCAASLGTGLKSKREFRTHLVMYVLVNAMLVVVWAVTDSGFFWPIFPIVGWGIGLGGHAWSIYGDKPIAEDEIRREMDRLR